MRNFNFDIIKMVRWLLPYFLVKPRHRAWLETLSAPIKSLYTDFLTYRQLQLRNATVNSSKNRLTRALRDKYEDETIYILHSNDYLNQSFIYLEEEGASLEYDYLYEEEHEPADFDYLDEEYNSEVDFVVRIPQAMAAKQLDVYEYVRKYVFTGIRFTIELF